MFFLNLFAALVCSFSAGVDFSDWLKTKKRAGLIWALVMLFFVAVNTVILVNDR